MNKRYIMRRKTDKQFFVTMRSNTGLGDLTTNDPNQAKIYSHPNPMGFQNIKRLWEAIEVQVTVVII